MSIKVENGVATIDTGSIGERYLGCTSEKGTFPPTGLDYDHFTFAPERGTSGILVFGAQPGRTTHDIYDGNYFLLFQYHWKKNKLVVDWGVTKPAHPYSDSKGRDNFGLMVQLRDRFYVTHRPADTSRDYHLVDLMTMVKFLAGAATFADLERNARHVVRHEQHLVRFKELNRRNECLTAEMRRLEEESHRRGLANDKLREAWNNEKASTTRAIFFARMLERVLNKRPFIRFVFRKLFSLNDHEYDAVYLVGKQASLYNNDNPRFVGYPDLT